MVEFVSCVLCVFLSYTFITLCIRDVIDTPLYIYKLNISIYIYVQLLFFPLSDTINGAWMKWNNKVQITNQKLNLFF